MKTLLALLLLLLAPATLASEAREVYPSDFKPHACAPSQLCGQLSRMEVLRFATTFRALDISPRWLRANWADLEAAMSPICAKIATCFATASNNEVFCSDLAKDEVLRTADRFPRESEDWQQWTKAALSYYLAHSGGFINGYKEARACLALQPASEEVRQLEAWSDPDEFGPDYKGRIRFYAIDRETRSPVMARVTISGQDLGKYDTADGSPMTTAEILWKIRFNRIPNPSGHEDVVVPEVTISADGYEPRTVKLGLEVPTAIVEMTPGASRLRPGRNTITVTSRDAATGEPVELRVMADDLVLGDTNQPLVLELPGDGRRPEIWVTSLFDRYNDLVIAPAK